MDFGPETFFLRVRGHAMAPLFVDEDWVWVDPDEPAADGRYVAVRDPEAGTPQVRLYLVRDGRRFLRALDPDVPKRELTRDNETDLLGTVVFRGNVPRKRP